MKHGKRPTRRQKILVKSMRLNPDNWFVEREDKSGMIIIHRDTGNVKVIRKLD